MEQKESGTCHLSGGVISLGIEPGFLWLAGFCRAPSAGTSIIRSSRGEVLNKIYGAFNSMRQMSLLLSDMAKPSQSAFLKFGSSLWYLTSGRLGGGVSESWLPSLVLAKMKTDTTWQVLSQMNVLWPVFLTWGTDFILPRPPCPTQSVSGSPSAVHSCGRFLDSSIISSIHLKHSELFSIYAAAQCSKSVVLLGFVCLSEDVKNLCDSLPVTSQFLTFLLRAEEFLRAAV